ncbi:MAG: hypothetical protein KGD58_13930 [Candidatus Lokiarchaeota archaeon]|nr:hypothetical protein [Candidatus Lokiarchaeota archaeon]
MAKKKAPAKAPAKKGDSYIAKKVSNLLKSGYAPIRRLMKKEGADLVAAEVN